MCLNFKSANSAPEFIGSSPAPTIGGCKPGENPSAAFDSLMLEGDIDPQKQQWNHGYKIASPGVI